VGNIRIPPISKHFNPGLEIIIWTDISKIGIVNRYITPKAFIRP